MTKDDLTISGYERLFAYDDLAAMNLVGSAKCGFNFYDGVPSMYSSFHGKRVNRADVNGIGRLMSQGGFFNRNGGYYTYDPKVADAIGGYPQGAILRYKDRESGLVRVVRSLVADNKFDFVSNPEYIDDVHWHYVDMITPVSCRPRVFPVWNEMESGELESGGSELVIERDSMLIIQSGPDKEHDAVAGDSPLYVWVNVRKQGQEDFHAAGMLAYIPPVSSAYTMTARSAEEIDVNMERKAMYTAYYSSSPIQLYLNAGDAVTISTNVVPKYETSNGVAAVYSYVADYWLFPLEA